MGPVLFIFQLKFGQKVLLADEIFVKLENSSMELI